MGGCDIIRTSFLGVTGMLQGLWIYIYRDIQRFVGCGVSEKWSLSFGHGVRFGVEGQGLVSQGVRTVGECRGDKGNYRGHLWTTY